MTLDIEKISPEGLEAYASIPIGFWVRSILRFQPVGFGLGGMLLAEEKVEPPYYKDYDAQEADASPVFWPKQFELSNWGLFLAKEDGKGIGGAAVAIRTAGVNMLEDRDDLAVLWDIRVHPDWRGAGIGKALFHQAVQWASSRGCTQLKIETQNVNVPACRFYARMGCVLGMIHRYGYAAVPSCAHEVMLCWYLDLG